MAQVRDSWKRSLSVFCAGNYLHGVMNQGMGYPMDQILKCFDKPFSTRLPKTIVLISNLLYKCTYTIIISAKQHQDSKKTSKKNKYTPPLKFYNYPTYLDVLHVANIFSNFLFYFILFLVINKTNSPLCMLATSLTIVSIWNGQQISRVVLNSSNINHVD